MTSHDTLYIVRDNRADGRLDCAYVVALPEARSRRWVGGPEMGPITKALAMKRRTAARVANLFGDASIQPAAAHPLDAAKSEDEFWHGFCDLLGG